MPSGRRIAVGAFVFGGILLFAAGLFLIGNRRKLFTRDFELYTEFSKLNGLQNGATVRVAGMDAGEILQVAVPPGPQSKFRVRFRVIEGLHPIVRTDSVASIQTDGLLGNKFLQVDAGTGDAPQARAGGTIPSKEPFDWADLMTQISDSVRMVNDTVADVKDDLQIALHSVASTTEEVSKVVSNAQDDLQRIFASTDRITASASDIVEGVRKGRGVVGGLFQDDQLAADVRQTAGNVRNTTENVNRIAADLQKRDIIPEVERAMRNVREVTDQLKTAAAKFQGAQADGGAFTDLRRTLANANEAMSDLADDMEALKRNWFFRGFFKSRGFYDLDDVTPARYKAGEFAQGHERQRFWLHDRELFTRTPDGAEVLSDQGKARLDKIMAELLKLPQNGPLMIEGYAAEGDASKQFLDSRSRAAQVRSYLLSKFGLKPTNVGTMPMGAVHSADGAASAGFWEGVAVVLFYKK